MAHRRLLLALGLLAPAVLAKPSAAASPAKPAPPLWAAYVKPEAVEAMKTFFEGDAAHKLKDDKSILNLAQGKPVEGVSKAPQLLPVFATPTPPPKAADMATWLNYNMFMVGFWYRFKFGFAIYKQVTKETGKWIDSAIKYFDILANGYFSMFAFLSLYTALESLKSFSWSDKSTYAAGYVSYLKVREAYAFMWWLFCQNTLDVLTIEEQLGFVKPESKVKAWYSQVTPHAMVRPAAALSASRRPLLCPPLCPSRSELACSTSSLISPSSPSPSVSSSTRSGGTYMSAPRA